MSLEEIFDSVSLTSTEGIGLTPEESDRLILERKKFRKNEELVANAEKFLDEITAVDVGEGVRSEDVPLTPEQELALAVSKREKLKQKINKFKQSKRVPTTSKAQALRRKRANKLRNMKLDLEDLEEEIIKLNTIVKGSDV